MFLMGSPVPEDEQTDYDEEKYDTRLEKALLKLEIEEKQSQKKKEQAEKPKPATTTEDDEYEVS